MNQSARSRTRKSDDPEPAVPFLYQCDHCPTSFRSSGLLARHVGRAHGGQKKVRYSGQEEYRTAHDGSTKPFKCPKCGVVFSRQATLVGHIQRHMQESEKHTCAVCDREFGTVNELRAHVYEGHESQKVQKIHIIQAPSKKLYECKLCENKSFPKKSLLERHFLVHTKQKPFKCLICNKCFNQKSTLNTHLLIHSGIQNFTCMLCGLKFSQKINLRVHTLRMHPKRSAAAAADRLPCPYCPCLFKKLGSLNAHKTKVHAELLPDPATTTSNEVESRVKDEPEVMGSMVVLKRTEDRVGIQSVVIPPSVSDPEVVQPVVASRTQLHLEGRSEERQHTCAICPAAFKKASHLTQHTRSHYGIKSNRCDICNRTFTTSHSLKVHRNSHNSTVPDFRCDQCPARFNLLSSLRRHVAIHENPDRSYSCPICKRNFKWFQNCKSHIRTSHAKELQEEKPPEPILTTETTQQSNETLIDLPPNVQIYDINNCLIRIDEYYQLPVQIETDQLTQEMVEIAQNEQLYDLPDHEISQEEILDQSNTPEPPNPKPEPINLLINPTEQDLFSEVLTNGKKCYVCRSCQKPFKKPIDLRRHIRTHTGERPFRCPQHQCGKTFTLKAVLQQHLKTHDERRDVLLCPEPDCRSKFTTKAALELHRRLHTGDRPFRCTVCTLMFRTSGHMQAHMDSHERLAVKREQNMLQFGA